MSDLKTESQDLQQEENALIALRKEKLAAERAKGNAFPTTSVATATATTCRSNTRTRPRKSWKQPRSRSR